MPRIIFDAAGVTEFAHHFQIVFRALFDALRFEQFALFAEHAQLLIQFRFNVFQRFCQFFLRRDEMFGGINVNARVFQKQFARERVNLGNAVNLVAKKFDAIRGLAVRGHHF
ncbi:MAG: hypothetical protein HDKAJFGB_02776 [Anaerolineae bacterium]|nr:hypothetical protein [Anaerolineae bacterium]